VPLERLSALFSPLSPLLIFPTVFFSSARAMRPVREKLQYGLRFVRKASDRRLERMAGLALATGSLLFLVLVLAQSWTRIVPYLNRMNGWLLVAGQACTLLALLLGGVTWTLVQTALGLGFGWREGIIIHFLSGITKYVPGYAWQYMSKAYLSRGRGASSRQIMVAMLTELVLLLTGGVIAASPGGLLISDRQLSLPLILPIWTWPLSGATALAVSVIWNTMVKRMLTSDRYQVRQGPLWLALGAAVVGWLAFAGAAWLISRAIYPVGVKDFPQYVVALVGSGVIGLLVIIVPGGLGVREMTLAVLLKGALPFSLGVVVSIVIRFSVVVGELLGSGVVLRLGWYQLRSIFQE